MKQLLRTWSMTPFSCAETLMPTTLIIDNPIVVKDGIQRACTPDEFRGFIC